MPRKERKPSWRGGNMKLDGSGADFVVELVLTVDKVNDELSDVTAEAELSYDDKVLGEYTARYPGIPNALQDALVEFAVDSGFNKDTPVRFHTKNVRHATNFINKLGKAVPRLGNTFHDFLDGVLQPGDLNAERE